MFLPIWLRRYIGIFDGNPVSLHRQLQKKYMSMRYFFLDNMKYCYNIDVKERAHYLVRTTFLYDVFNKSPIYPKFEISLGVVG